MSLPLWLAPPDHGDDSSSGSDAQRDVAQRRRRLAMVRAAEDAPDPLTAADLPERLRAGDPGAFDDLFSATYVGLVRFGMRLVASREAAEDIVMDVFRRVWERRAEWRPDDARVYLFGAVRNAALTAVRDNVTRSGRLALAGNELPGHSANAPQLDETLDQNERLRALARAIDALPDRQRLIFTMRREQGLTNAQVGAVLGIAVKTVEKDMTAAFKTLRQALAQFRDES